MKSIPKNRQESQLFINPKKYKHKKTKKHKIYNYIINNKYSTIIIIIIIIIISLIILFTNFTNILHHFKKKKKNLLYNIRTKWD